MKSYCVKQRKQTECVPGSERVVQTRNGRAMMKCKCAECGITKTKFIKSQSTGGALARRRGPSAVDKAAWVMSNFVTPAPSFASLGKILASQGLKGITDNINYYKKGRGRKGKGLLLGKNSPFKGIPLIGAIL